VEEINTSLLRKSVNYGRKKLYKISPRFFYATTDKLQRTRLNLGRVFYYVSVYTFHPFEAKRTNLNLKNYPKQLLGSLLLDITPPQ
jgi:hypothetical protein